MRIVSLLPSLTELVCAFSRSDDLVGVTHECDFPPGVQALPHLTRSRLPSVARSSEINALVVEQAGSLYELLADKLAELQPDLILTQEQCDVCAVSETTVRFAARRLASAPFVESVNPTTLDGVFAMFRRVAALLDCREAGDALVAHFGSAASEIAAARLAASPGQPVRARRRVVLLEWLDPPYCAGHWNPELIQLAGGEEVLGRTGEKSRATTWEEVASSRPDVILVAPCGYTLARASLDLLELSDRPEWRALAAVRAGRVAVVDGSAYFSRPGPRLLTSLRIAACAIDPDSCRSVAPPEGEGWMFCTSDSDA